MKKEIMSPERLTASLGINDLSDPKNGIHAINLVLEKVCNGLKRNYPKINLEILRKNPVVTVKENFDDLLFPPDNIGRSSRYTRYVSDNTILRTHTSANISSWLQVIAKQKIDAAMIATPGICYRRDVVDKTHNGELHQMDVWRIQKGEPKLKRNDMLELIETILESIIPGCEYKTNNVEHPYTINGLEVEVLTSEGWLEVLECGEAHPMVLKNAGLNPKLYSGLALGMGLDRLVMIIKSIDDIRILWSDDPRIKKQLQNLDTFVPVSNQPKTKRVLSYSASVDKTEEDICEEIKDELGKNTSFVEEIDITEVSFEELPEKARGNLGISPEQKNVIATIIFRSIDKSLPREKVNFWMQELYPKLNKGTKGYM